MNALTKSQIDHNTASALAWELFAEHRKNVTSLLLERATPGQSRLCVLGAGNCNDLNLRTLADSYREIHLVDLDATALARGVIRQGAEGNPALHQYGGVDLTGMLDTLAAFPAIASGVTPDLTRFVDAPVRRVAAKLPGPFDVVASTCLLSQLMASVLQAIGDRHPSVLTLLQAVRTGHLRLLSHLLTPGGAGVLITDVVSSDTAPSLASVTDEMLAEVLLQLIAERNFFHGINPGVIASLFRSDPVLSAEATDLSEVPPWRWNLGPRVYAVWALRMRKRR